MQRIHYFLSFFEIDEKSLSIKYKFRNEPNNKILHRPINIFHIVSANPPLVLYEDLIHDEQIHTHGHNQINLDVTWKLDPLRLEP